MKYLVKCLTDKTVVHQIQFEDSNGNKTHNTPFKRTYKNGDKFTYKTKKDALKSINLLKEDGINAEYIGGF
jgi:hypothetical protein